MFACKHAFCWPLVASSAIAADAVLGNSVCNFAEGCHLTKGRDDASPISLTLRKLLLCGSSAGETTSLYNCIQIELF